MNAAPRELIIMRHGKADQFGTTDHARELTARGIADATDAGRWAREAGVLPDHALVSSSARTTGTWEAFCDGAGARVEAVIDPSLYAADTDAVLEILRDVPDEAHTVIVIGHNPTMAHLVHLLDDGGADPDAFARLSTGYPTSALTVLDVQTPWKDLDYAGARIRAHHVGRG